MTRFTVETYDYKNVRTPAGAISMKQMMNEQRR